MDKLPIVISIVILLLFIRQTSTCDDKQDQVTLPTTFNAQIYAQFVYNATNMLEVVKVIVTLKRSQLLRIFFPYAALTNASFLTPETASPAKSDEPAKESTLDDLTFALAYGPNLTYTAYTTQIFDEKSKIAKDFHTFVHMYAIMSYKQRSKVINYYHLFSACPDKPNDTFYEKLNTAFESPMNKFALTLVNSKREATSNDDADEIAKQLDEESKHWDQDDAVTTVLDNLLMNKSKEFVISEFAKFKDLTKNELETVVKQSGIDGTLDFAYSSLIEIIKNPEAYIASQIKASTNSAVTLIIYLANDNFNIKGIKESYKNQFQADLEEAFKVPDAVKDVESQKLFVAIVRDY